MSSEVRTSALSSSWVAEDAIKDAGVEISILKDRLAAEMNTKSGAPATPDPNSSGWVLIMDDTPSPAKDAGQDSWHPAPSAYRSKLPTSASSPTFPKSGLPTHTSRRPRSRLSGASMSTTTTVSSIPTPTSRPATPTFLPLPSSLYSNGRTPGLKSSIGPGAFSSGQSKRTSLSSNSCGSPPLSDNGIKPHDHPGSYNVKSDRCNVTHSPSFLPRLYSNGSPRGSSRIPSSASAVSVLSQSKIGRPVRKNGADPLGEEKEGGRFLGLSGYMKNRARTASSFGR